MSKIIPVIHTVDFKQVTHNIQLCHANGIDDIFLIDHRVTDTSLEDIKSYIDWIRSNIPDMRIGANFLQLDTIEALDKSKEFGIDYIWADRSYIDNKTLNIAEKAYANKGKQLYFGCVAFKYQRPVKNLKWTCQKACELMDVITTSGTKTGVPPTLAKIKEMKAYIGDKSLAIASGITPENKEIFTEYVDYFLVASSIIDKNEMIIESKLKQLIK